MDDIIFKGVATFLRRLASREGTPTLTCYLESNDYFSKSKPVLNPHRELNFNRSKFLFIPMMLGPDLLISPVHLPTDITNICNYIVGM